MGEHKIEKQRGRSAYQIVVDRFRTNAGTSKLSQDSRQQRRARLCSSALRELSRGSLESLGV